MFASRLRACPGEATGALFIHPRYQGPAHGMIDQRIEGSFGTPRRQTADFSSIHHKGPITDSLRRKEGDKETAYRTLSSNHDKAQPSCAWTQTPSRDVCQLSHRNHIPMWSVEESRRPIEGRNSARCVAMRFRSRYLDEYSNATREHRSIGRHSWNVRGGSISDLAQGRPDPCLGTNVSDPLAFRCRDACCLALP